jgi:hypothetical protein
MAVLLTGCQDNPPTAVSPPGDRPAQDWTSEVEWHAVGSFDIPVPIGGAIPWTSTGITVNDTGWVRVQITGGVTLKFNDDYKAMCVGSTYLQPPFCPMGAPLAGASLSPAGRRDFDDYMAVMVGIDRGHGPEFVTTGWFTDSPGFYGGVVHGPGTIMVARRDLGWTINDLSPFDVFGAEEIRVDVIGPAETGCGGKTTTVGVRAASLDCMPADASPELVLRCNGQTGSLSIGRADQVTCGVYSPEARSVTVREWRFGGVTRSDGDLTSTVWEGRVVQAGVVSATASVEGSGDQNLTLVLAVSPRAWNEVQLTVPPHVTIELDTASMDLYPASGLPQRTFGRFLFPWPDIAKDLEHVVTVGEIKEGPNAGLSYVERIPDLPAPTIYLHPALFPDAGVPIPESDAAVAMRLVTRLWYYDQNGHGSGTCRASNIAAFEKRIEHHEGASMAADSHYGKTNEAFRRFHSARKLEEIVGHGNDNVLAAVGSMLSTFHDGSFLPIQAAFDNTDTPNVYAALHGCTLDFNAQDN